MVDERREGHREALKKVAVALKQAEIRFALGGGYAAWVRGAPEPEHDVDFLIRESDAEHAKTTLAEAGLRVEQPPEDWLFKVYDGDAMVDVLFQSSGFDALTPLLDRAEDVSVLSVRMPVLTATDLLTCKLNALDEHQCDFARLLPVARSVREQVDWATVRETSSHNDFAAAFLVLLDRLGITPGVAQVDSGVPAGSGSDSGAQADDAASDSASRRSPSSTDTAGA